MVSCKRRVNAGNGGGHKMIITRKMKHFDKHISLGNISSNNWDRVVNKTDNINVIVEEWLFSLL